MPQVSSLPPSLARFVSLLCPPEAGKGRVAVIAIGRAWLGSVFILHEDIVAAVVVRTKHHHYDCPPCQASFIFSIHVHIIRIIYTRSVQHVDAEPGTVLLRKQPSSEAIIAMMPSVVTRAVLSTRELFL